MVNYTYDDNNNLDLVKVGSTTLADYDYDVLDRRVQKTFTEPATNQAAVYSYDLANQLQSIANTTLPSTNIATYAYPTFDPVGNRTRMDRTFTTGSAATTNYSYNNIYELTGTTGTQSHSYAYDALGNRSTADSTAYTANSLNQYTAVGGSTYTNSANGNITYDGTNTYGYDLENRLVSFDAVGTSNDAIYAYDALGRRVSKTVNGTTTYFVYDGDDIIADYDTSSLLREYIHGDSVDEILAMEAGANTYYYHYDGLGSVTEITDGSGAIAENYTYDPYGTPSVTASSINNRYRFTGREYDEESGLYHYRARAYSPAIGRFQQRDSLEYEDSMNLYQYTLNNPVNYADPNGENVAALAPLLGVPVVGEAIAGLTISVAVGVGIYEGYKWLAGMAQGSNSGFCTVMFSKGGKQNVRDTGLEKVSDEEVSKKARDKNLSPEERRRYLKEEKGRGIRNKQKR